MRSLLLSFFLVVLSVARAGDALDDPLPAAPSFQALVESFRVIESRLGRDDFFAFSTAWSELLEPLRHLKTGITDADQEATALRVFAGLSPRQIILLGHQVRVLRAKYALACGRADDPDPVYEAEIRESVAIMKRCNGGVNRVAGGN